jgi:hypothetical protein
MTTVKQLIQQLQENHDPDEAIVFQYLVAEFTSYPTDVFENLAGLVMDSNTFGENSTQFFLDALVDAEYEVED